VKHSNVSAYHPAILYAGSMALAATGIVVVIRLRTDVRILQKV
jgi:hypothetical protein